MDVPTAACGLILKGGILKKTVRALALLITVGVVTGVVVTAATANSSGVTTKSSGVTTIHLVEKDKAFHFVDNPPLGGQNKPPSMGDEAVFTSELLTRSGKHVGLLHATCTVTSGGKHTVMSCFGTFGLKGGQLAGMATLGEAKTDRIAIVGGTGIYAGARGEATSVSRGENSPFSDTTIRLQRP
jgi:hypothetical protein